MKSKIALIPLDERPVNTRYPAMLAKIAGVELVLPPHEVQGLQRSPAELEKIAQWLTKSVEVGVSAVIASIDYFAYGNLINARISNESAVSVLRRISLLEEIGSKVPVHAYSLITRVANSNDIVEEPLYWQNWGTLFYSYARFTHMEELGDLNNTDRDELLTIESNLPQDLKADWLARRLRNHTVNMAAVDMALRGKIKTLLLTSDDTSQFGFPTRERNWIKSWLELVGSELSSSVQMHPGADEVGSALLAKLVNEQNGTRPKVWVDYAINGDEELVAPYEDRPVRETVLGQIEACGCELAENVEESDFVLGVVTPSPRRKDYNVEFLEDDRTERSGFYRDFLERLGSYQKSEKPIALADVAYPNGSDPLMSEMLLSDSSPLEPGTLCAYGAWNTAGNSLGVVVAQASCTLCIDGNPERQLTQKQFLAHRFLEDYGYQQVVRRKAREFSESSFGTRDPNPESKLEVSSIAEFIEVGLGDILGDLQTHGIGLGLRIVLGSVRLPWNRTFEVDFELDYDGTS